MTVSIQFTKSVTEMTLPPATSLKSPKCVTSIFQSPACYHDGNGIYKRERRSRRCEIVYEQEVHAVAVSRDVRCVITLGGDFNSGELLGWG
jgi:hypothetical protein